MTQVQSVDSITISNADPLNLAVRITFRVPGAEGSFTALIPGGDDSLQSIQRTALLQVADNLRDLAGRTQV